VTPVKKPRRKAIAKKGATVKTQTITTAPTVVAASVIPTPSASPLNEEDETSQIPALFQNYSFRMLEEFERVKVDRERLLNRESNLLIEMRCLVNRVKELENLAEIGLMDQILSLAQNYKSSRGGSKIVQDALMAAEVSELDVQTHPAYPSRQPENVVYYVQPQNFYQPPEPYRGVRDVMISTSNVVQKRATNQIPNLSSYQIQNQTHQNF
jgi:hypothetical protein